MSETTNPVLEAIHERRSIRKYTDEPVSREDLTAILEAGRWAPTGLNNQPCRFAVALAGSELQEGLAGQTKYGHVVRGAGALIALLLDKTAVYNEMKDHQAAGATMQNMMLAAHSLGLGSVWLGEIVNQSAGVLGVLGLDPEKYELQAVLAVGHPAQKGSSSRKPLADMLLGDF